MGKLVATSHDASTRKPSLAAGGNPLSPLSLRSEPRNPARDAELRRFCKGRCTFLTGPPPRPLPQPLRPGFVSQRSCWLPASASSKCDCPRYRRYDPTHCVLPAPCTPHRPQFLSPQLNTSGPPAPGHRGDGRFVGHVHQASAWRRDRFCGTGRGCRAFSPSRANPAFSFSQPNAA